MDGLTVNKLARQSGVNPQTVRYYEREGVLPRAPRTPGGYRAFPLDCVARVRFVKRAQELGFSLDEVKELLVLRDHPQTACPDVLKRAEAKITSIAAKIRNLQAIRRQLVRLAKSCDGRARPHTCPLLNALDENRKESHEHPNNDSTKAERPVEFGRGGGGGDRGIDMLSRAAAAGRAGHRRNVGRKPPQV
jgi:MerR family mercuric resistance operon transcriptional regulator